MSTIINFPSTSTCMPASSRISISSGFSLMMAMESAVLPSGSVQFRSKLGTGSRVGIIRLVHHSWCSHLSPWTLPRPPACSMMAATEPQSPRSAFSINLATTSITEESIV